MKSSFYDGYDYPKYWQKREYEHKCEIFAIKKLMEKIPEPRKIADIGCGFGRLVPAYYREKSSIFLFDPSSDLLTKAKKNHKDKKNIFYINHSLEEIPKKYENKFDLAVIVRVLHHIDDLKKAFKKISAIVRPEGYAIIEFANKMHGKDQLKHLLRGNFTYPLDIFSIDKRKSKKKDTINFLNHHPDVISQYLDEYGFEVKEIRSVSNFRNSQLKKALSSELLLSLEKNVQKILAKLYFGPSVFILAKKV